MGEGRKNGMERTWPAVDDQRRNGVRTFTPPVHEMQRHLILLLPILLVLISIIHQKMLELVNPSLQRTARPVFHPAAPKINQTVIVDAEGPRS